jgi:hypothetical protein
VDRDISEGLMALAFAAAAAAAARSIVAFPLSFLYLPSLIDLQGVTAIPQMERKATVLNRSAQGSSKQELMQLWDQYRKVFKK